MVGYFWDSYAAIELIGGNKSYAKYIHELVRTSIFNLAEIYWFALNEYEEEKAEEIYERFKKGVVEINDVVLKDAVKFRKRHKNKNLSYADCIGYVYALKNNLIFLTGDKEFANFSNVEFVK